MNAHKIRSPQGKGELKRASQDSSVSSSESITNGISSKTSAHVHELVNSLKESGKTHGKNVVVNKPLTRNEKLAIIFPFIEPFQKLGRQQLGTLTLTALESLMATYLSHLSLAVENCYGKPARAALMKGTISDALLFFHMIYTEIKQPLEQSSYFDKMSDLLAFYIDMEIKASVRRTEPMPKIGSKITMSLFLFLEKSQDHILDTILKTKLMMVRSFWELCAPIFNRVLEVPHGIELVDLTYTRYLLVFKMWKKCMEIPEDRRKIMKLAEDRLTPPPNFAQTIKTGVLRGILPRLRKSRPDITLFLMEAKFCIKTKTLEFFKAIGDPKNRNNLLPLQLDKGLFFEEDKAGDNNEEQDEFGLKNIWTKSNMTAKEQIRMANVVKPDAKAMKRKKTRKEMRRENLELTKRLKQLENTNNVSKKLKCENVTSTIQEEPISDDDDVIIIEDPKVTIDLEAEKSPEAVKSPEKSEEQTENMEVDVPNVDKIQVKNDETPIFQKEENPISQVENSDLLKSVENTLTEIEKSKSDENLDYSKMENSHYKRFDENQIEFDFPSVQDSVVKEVEEFDFFSSVVGQSMDYDFPVLNDPMSEPLNLGSKPTRKFPTAAELKEIPDTGHCLTRAPISPTSYNFDSNELKGAYGPMENIVPLVTPAMRKENAVQSFPTPLVFPTLEDERDDRSTVYNFYQDTQFSYHTPDSGFDLQPTSELDDFVQHISQDTSDPVNLTGEGMWLHRVVVIRDSFIFNLLRIVRKFVLESLDVKDVRLPNPPENLQPSDPSNRCGCPRCKDNLKRMWANYLLLQKNKKNKEFTPERKKLLDTIENEIKDYLIKSETEEPRINLPFKKRKAMMPPARKESVDEISYPSTPMLSIAALEDCKMVNYYPRTYPSVIMQYPTPSTSASPDATVDPNLYAKPQLYRIPPVDLHAAQTLMTIANGYAPPPPPPKPKSKKTTRKSSTRGRKRKS